MHEFDYDGEFCFLIVTNLRKLKNFNKLNFQTFSDDDQEELDSDEDDYYRNQNVDTSRVDEIPAKEPKFNAVSWKAWKLKLNLKARI